MSFVGNKHNRWLKSRRTGEVFDWHPQLAVHPDLQEVTAEQAYPESFENKEVVDNPPSKKRGRKTKVDVVVEEPPLDDEELNRATTAKPWGSGSPITRTVLGLDE